MVVNESLVPLMGGDNSLAPLAMVCPEGGTLIRRGMNLTVVMEGSGRV